MVVSNFLSHDASPAALSKLTTFVIFLLGSSCYLTEKVFSFMNHPSLVCDSYSNRLQCIPSKKRLPLLALFSSSEDDATGITSNSSTRRDIFIAAVAAIPAFSSLTSDEVFAFENRISTAYDDRPKRKGPQVCA